MLLRAARWCAHLEAWHARLSRVALQDPEEEEELTEPPEAVVPVACLPPPRRLRGLAPASRGAEPEERTPASGRGKGRGTGRGGAANPRPRTKPELAARVAELEDQLARERERESDAQRERGGRQCVSHNWQSEWTRRRCRPSWSAGRRRRCRGSSKSSPRTPRNRRPAGHRLRALRKGWCTAERSTGRCGCGSPGVRSQGGAASGAAPRAAPRGE